MPDNDKIINFPGAQRAAAQPASGAKAAKTAKSKAAASAPGIPDPGRFSPAGSGAVGIPGLTEDQEKAIQIILSGMSFVTVGLRPTGGGADFFNALDGQTDELRNAAPHLAGVVERALRKRGVL
jgi:hypothetical protein